MCKKLKFDHTNTWYFYNPESISENETHTVLRDFKIQTDPQILARRPERVIVNEKNKKRKKKRKENLPNSRFRRPGGQ